MKQAMLREKPPGDRGSFGGFLLLTINYYPVVLPDQAGAAARSFARGPFHAIMLHWMYLPATH
jgi:hypothetical protein